MPSSPRPEGNLPRSRGELGMGGVKGIAVGASVTYGSNSALALCYILLKGRVSATRDRVAPSYRKSVCCKPRVEDFNIVKTTDLIEYK